MAPVLDYNKYTVAWIAVLKVEAQAALAVLDHQHDGYFESSREDDYDYIGGDINGHNVVVATLPAGRAYGKSVAASLASQVKLRFPNIWFALLVGIATGLPNLSAKDPSRVRDIRLGDVLVSVPDQQSSGVLQYDLGRQTTTGFFVNGQLSPAPMRVRAAFRRIELTSEEPYKRGSQLAQILEVLQDNDQESAFVCPSQEEDQLFAIPAGKSAESSLIQRECRDEQERTLVWYGRIGSGDTLMHDPQRCDELRDRYDLIGLETEAAGVVNCLPTGVIKGVYNYGDGYENRKWQPYAAAVAAVYAKGVLCTIAPRLVVSEPKPKPSTIIPFRRDPSFVRRPEFDMLTRKMSAAATSVTLTGVSGVGKSQLAIEYGYSVHEESPSTWVFWVHASSASRFEEGFRNIAQTLKLPGWDDPQTNLLMPVYRWLCDEGNDQWVLVLDNMDDPQLLYNAYIDINTSTISGRLNCGQGGTLAHFIPHSRHGKTLITTKNREVGFRLSRFEDVLSIPAMTQNNALALLRGHLCASLFDCDYAVQLVQELEFMPMAITQAAAYICHHSPRISLQQYVEHFRESEDGRLGLLRYDTGDLRRDPSATNSVLMALQLSFDEIWSRHGSALKLLSLMSFFNQHEIPEFLLKRSFESLDEEDGSNLADGAMMAASQTGLDTRLEKSIQTLRNYDLITLDFGQRTFGMHALVRLAVRRWLHTNKQYTWHKQLFTTGLFGASPTFDSQEYIVFKKSSGIS